MTRYCSLRFTHLSGLMALFWKDISEVNPSFQHTKIELLTADEATRLAGTLEEKRDLAVEKISRAFGLLPVRKPERDIKDPTRRQPCKKNGMER